MKTVIKDPFIDGLIEEGLTRGIEQGRVEGRVVGRVEGRAAGEADAILRVLDARGLKATAAQRERISRCDDLKQLQEWITRIATATTVDGIFE
jgi:predicted transposase YdaD